MSAFELYAAQRVIDQAKAAGVDLPAGIDGVAAMCHTDGPYAAREWARLHPDDFRGCCWGETISGPAGCTCWVPVYEMDQQPPRPPASRGDVETAAGKCADCAFRPDSPERADDWTAEALYDSARRGVPFWCHQGMRKPARWVHPDGRVVEGSPDDWTPPMVDGVPFRADGSPGLLCAGWAAVGQRQAATL